MFEFKEIMAFATFEWIGKGATAKISVPFVSRRNAQPYEVIRVFKSDKHKFKYTEEILILDYLEELFGVKEPSFCALASLSAEKLFKWEEEREKYINLIKENTNAIKTYWRVEYETLPPTKFYTAYFPLCSRTEIEDEIFCNITLKEIHAEETVYSGNRKKTRELINDGKDAEIKRFLLKSALPYLDWDIYLVRDTKQLS